MGLLLVDVFLRWGRLVSDSGWIFTLIWVPLIMVPDSSQIGSKAFSPTEKECGRMEKANQA
jgi:hypothetical protein